MLHDRTLLKHGSHFASTRHCPAQPSRAVRPRYGRKARNDAEDKQLTAIQHVHNGKNVSARSNLSMVSSVLRVHFRKAEAAYRRPQTSKPWPRMMLESYILLNICPCYFSLRISMNYTENVTELVAHA